MKEYHCNNTFKTCKKGKKKDIPGLFSLEYYDFFSLLFSHTNY